MRQKDKEACVKSTKQAKPESVKHPAVPKMRNMRLITAGRVVLWAALGIILLRGMLAILFPADTQQHFDALAAQLSVVENKIDTVNEAGAFAESFTREYFTYTARGSDDYKRRLTDYCGAGLASEICESVALKGGAKAIYTAVVDTATYSANQQDLTVLTVVEYTTEQPARVDGQDVLQQTTVQSIVYLAVPVYFSGGLYLVEDMPMITAAPPPATDYTEQLPTGVIADEPVKKQAQTMLEDFFKTLYSEEQRRIDYYLTEDANKQRLREIKSSFTFLRIDALTVYCGADVNTYTAVVMLRLEDKSGSLLKQRVTVSIVSNGSRMYVRDINLRSHNLKG